ncbi:hypothetical protein V8J36_09830 [Frigidibacter sp. MR17.14]|uniref:hypothetical protein n=1 Tax=Frigidibacter sp. MR17.14 TaxID=3126509 RepID=UPI00301301D1
MLKRLKDIQSRLDTLGARIEAITADRRADERRKIFSDIRHNLEAVDTLGTRTSKVATAEAAEKDLARAATHLSEGFADTVETLHRAPIDLQALDALWTLAAAIRLCHEAGLRALFSIDELAAAEELARRRAGAFLDLSASLSPDAIARLHAAGAADWQAQEAARRAAMAQAGTFVTGLRESVTAVASQGELAQVLRARGIAGPDYIRELAEERQAPLLTLAA